jgi:hypothetical protein
LSALADSGSWYGLAPPVNVGALGASPDASAQTRFDVLSGESVAAVRGLNVYTIRDNQLTACYSVFVIDGPELPVQEPAPPPTAELYEKARVAQALKDAMAVRDRQVMELQQKRLTWAINYGNDRERIQAEYEQTVRGILPGLYPSAQVAPGWPTSTPQEINAAAQRAIADAETSSTVDAAFRMQERIEYLLRHATASARLAVTGPVACPAPAGSTNGTGRGTGR